MASSSRSFPQRPILGVGAVILDGSQVVLARRAHEPLRGQWSLPGGAVEVGETLEAAVVREVAEETGLHVAVESVVEIVERIQRTADGRVEFHFIIVDYVCRVEGSLELTPGSDADAVCWADCNALGSFGITDQAIVVIQKARTIAPSAARSRH